MDVRIENCVTIQKHWKDTVVFTDALHIEPWEWGEIGEKVPEGELLPGELSATTLWCDGLRVTHEISARHNDAPEGKFTYICRAAEARDGRWKEHISAIYSVKESEFIPDKYAF